jgi:hypothetical protein
MLMALRLNHFNSRNEYESVWRKEKQKRKEIGEGTSLPLPERFELRGESHRCSEM